MGEFLVLVYIGASFFGIVFLVGRLACPRYDRVPLREVDRVIAWTTLRRGFHTLSALGPMTAFPEDPPEHRTSRD